MTLGILIDRPRVRSVVIASAVLGALIGLDTLRVHLQVDPLADVHAYYDAGARLNAGQPLYEQVSTTNDPDFYRYPPLLAIAFRPLALLPFETAAAIWEALLVVLFVLTIVRLDWRDRWTWIVLGWLAAPFAWSLAVGQAQVAVTFLLAVGAPWAVAVAAHLKLLPVLVAIFWIGRRDWRALARLTAWGLGLLVISFVLEPAGTLAYLTFPDLGQVGEVRNLSPYAFSPWIWFVGVAAGLVVAWRVARTRWGWPVAVALSVLASPRLLMYMFSTLAAAKGGPTPEHGATIGPAASSSEAPPPTDGRRDL
jgi:Glycosyltransferase family 87